MSEKTSTSITVSEIKKNMRCELGESAGPVPAPVGNSRHPQDLLAYTGPEFVEKAYQLILGRDPDADGLSNYCDKLRYGRVTRQEIIVALRFSSEGRQRKAQIPGLPAAFIATIFCRIPLFKNISRSLLLARAWPLAQSQTQRQIAALRKQVLESQTQLTSLRDRCLGMFDDRLIDADLYQAFEDNFRGAPELIKKRLAVYQPLLDRLKSQNLRSQKCLDLGCGRGEWLELLVEQGFSAEGVDLSATAVAACTERELSAYVVDVLEYLKEVEDESVLLVSAFHIFEHLHPQVMFNLFVEIHRVLVPQGLLLMETPNPTNILVSAYDFYRDPTHRNPLHPETLLFFARQFKFNQVSGFFVDHTNSEGSTLIPNTEWRLDTVEDYFKAPRDFALTGVK